MSQDTSFGCTGIHYLWDYKGFKVNDNLGDPTRADQPGSNKPVYLNSPDGGTCCTPVFIREPRHSTSADLTSHSKCEEMVQPVMIPFSNPLCCDVVHPEETPISKLL